jgi:hypothetical protein
MNDEYFNERTASKKKAIEDKIFNRLDIALIERIALDQVFIVMCCSICEVDHRCG